MSGWIKLHRAFSEWEWSDDPNMVALFIHLLITANFEDKNWKGIPVKKGQLIAGRKKMAETTGISEQSIRTCLERLKSTKEVTISSVSKYSIITITNWEKYQDTNQMSNHEVTSNQPATNQQLTTPKELKKERTKELKLEEPLSTDVDISPIEKKVKKNGSPKKGTRLDPNWKPDEQDWKYAADQGLDEVTARREFEKFQNYWISKSGSNATKLNWSRTWRNWCLQAVEHKASVRGPNNGTGSKQSSSNYQDSFEAAGRVVIRRAAERGDF